MAEVACAEIPAFEVLGTILALAEIAGVDAAALFTDRRTAVVVLFAGAAEDAVGITVVVADVAEWDDVLAAHAAGAGVVVSVSGDDTSS